ncbi:hypothetical protein F2Q69_00046792 [Brassica cretica]|uniref:Uncharacterized protein n=1 Tax=Brassica cretica TaxID=69181 RepID=A0A8S9PHQ8_BRACR|nr:hypothetical protein F2Q69_00046792 [Brassica cretica]
MRFIGKRQCLWKDTAIETSEDFDLSRLHLSSNRYDGRNALLQLNEEKPIVLYEGSSHDSSVDMDYGVAENARCISNLKSGQDSGKEEEEDQEIGANNVFKKGCLLMIHGRVEEKHASGQCFEIRAR